MTRTSDNTLGYTFRDRLTGFVGVAIGYATHITGCDQVGLQPPVAPDKPEVPEARWFDVTRLEQQDVARIVIGNLTPERVAIPSSERTGADDRLMRSPGLRR